MTAQDVQPTPATEGEVVIHQNPPRYSYPKDVLKHHFLPYGSLSEGNEALLEGSGEVDVMVVDAPSSEPAPEETKSKRAKKRKEPEPDADEVGSAKKAKKTKTGTKSKAK